MATTTDYINQLKSDKTNLVNNLIEKGVSAAQDETFTSLVPKVLNIETGITPTGTINITENGTYDVTDKASANVNVGGGDLSEYFGGKLKAGDSSYYYSKLFENIKKIPLLEIEGTSCQDMFRGCKLLTSIPLLDTSNVTNMGRMFLGCQKLTTIPQLDTSKVTTMSNMFNSCSGITTIPLLDTSNVTTMSSMFSSCRSLTNIPQLNTSNVTTVYGMFGYCDALISLPLLNFSNVIDIRYLFDSTSSGTLTILGGFQNLGQAYLTTQSANYNNYKLDLIAKYNLTHDSLMNVINNLYDIASKGVKTQQLLLGSTNISKLSAEQLAIGTSKGWSIS